MPISCLLPISMPYISSRTNPTFCSTKQAQFLSHPLFTKYDHNQQHTMATTRVLQSVQKPRLRLTSCISSKPDCFELENENDKDDDHDHDHDHVHDPLRTVSDLMEAQKKKRGFLAVLNGVISVFYSYKALAASGGVMGAGSFSSYSSSSSDSSWSSSSSSDSSWSSSSPSPSSSSSYSYSSPSPSSSHSYSSPSSSSSSSSDDSSWSSSSDTEYESEPSKPYRSTYSESESKYTTSTSVAPENQVSSTKTGTEGLWILIVLVSIVGIAVFCAMHKDTTEDASSYRVMHEYKTGVIKFQVALLGSARSFQSDINEIAKVADTSTRRGFKNILTESLLALNRHSAYWESSHLSVYKEQCVNDGEKRFSGISFEERSKFDQETLVNLDSSKRTGKLRQQLDDPSHDYIVVTFIVAVLGILELPTPKSRSDITAIVQKLRSIHEKDILAVQVLWTPQDENDTLSSERVLKDYPLLQPL